MVANVFHTRCVPTENWTRNTTISIGEESLQLLAETTAGSEE